MERVMTLACQDRGLTRLWSAGESRAVCQPQTREERRERWEVLRFPTASKAKTEIESFACLPAPLRFLGSHTFSNALKLLTEAIIIGRYRRFRRGR